MFMLELNKKTAIWGRQEGEKTKWENVRDSEGVTVKILS